MIRQLVHGEAFFACDACGRIGLPYSVQWMHTFGTKGKRGRYLCAECRMERGTVPKGKTISEAEAEWDAAHPARKE